MKFSTVAPVIGGFAVATVFAVILVTSPKSVDGMTDDELRQLIASEYPQFQALKERYPQTEEQIERIEGTTYMRYEAVKMYTGQNYANTPFVDNPQTLSVVLTIDPLSARSIQVVCASGLSATLPATVDAIKTTDCLEKP